MIRVKFFMGFLLLTLTTLAILMVIGNLRSQNVDRHGVVAKRLLVKRLGLTDLSLWSEARYSRNPSQADIFTSFQDFPGSFDHFPAGSIIQPNIAGLTTSLRIRKSAKRESR